jgi:hypothetical protein
MATSVADDGKDCAWQPASDVIRGGSSPQVRQPSMAIWQIPPAFQKLSSWVSTISRAEPLNETQRGSVAWDRNNALSDGARNIREV